MIPFLVLIVTFALLSAAGWAGLPSPDGWAASLRIALAAMLLVTASAHWGRKRLDVVAMVPPSLPNAPALVTVTGVLEIAGAIGLVIPATAKWAAAGLILMLIAMLPANIYAARRGLTLGGRPVTPLVPRIALQIVFIAAVLLAGWPELVG